MSSMFSRRRRALRVAATSAAVAAAVLGPAAGAFAAQTGAADGSPAAVGTHATHVTAAPAKTAHASAKTAPAPVKPAAELPASDRYAGQPVYIGKGYVAVLRNDPAAGGPEAWIRYVGPHWKPGDTYMVRVIDLLDRGHRTASLDGMTLRLLDADGSAPKLQVTGPQGTKTYALPRSAKPGAKPAAKPAGHRATKPATATATAATLSDVKATVSDAKATGGQTKVVPKGSVAAGAEGVGDSDHTLVLAGGAFASAGAAGIAIAVLRRRQDAGSQG
ncbi:hypothetical protein [Streptomyces sp. S186]|uniref:hypothetical protein n=1 Tax=Streptomyces sp. S186 TaxID=3434395 RepID=UPI003F679443